MKSEKAMAEYVEEMKKVAQEVKYALVIDTNKVCMRTTCVSTAGTQSYISPP